MLGAVDGDGRPGSVEGSSYFGCFGRLLDVVGHSDKGCFDRKAVVFESPRIEFG